MADGESEAATAFTLPPGASSDLAALLAGRESVKQFTTEPITVQEAGAFLRHSAGAVGSGRRSHASARGQYLVRITMVAGAVSGLEPGAYRYDPIQHEVLAGARGDHRAVIAEASVDAPWLAKCPLIAVLSADIAAADERFSELGAGHGERFAWLEAGLITQNAYLWAALSGLGTVFIGGLDARGAARAAHGVLPDGETVIGLMPLGHPADLPCADGRE